MRYSENHRHLKAGGLYHEVLSKDPYRSKVVGLPHTGVHTGRVRVFGGTTTLWAGQALALSPIDFEARDLGFSFGLALVLQ
jgi:hypothetical protein